MLLDHVNLVPTPGLHIHFWIDDSTPVFAIVAKVVDCPADHHRPKVNLTFLSPESAKWLSKVEVDPTVDDGTKVYKAQRWSYLNEHQPDIRY